ncbi:MAG: uncharacterized protein JWM11_2213, partial [Planctomycetaceae bacterium]|nr:uncharacterized protein [Planctomycetaceae bacterium]
QADLTGAIACGSRALYYRDDVVGCGLSRIFEIDKMGDKPCIRGLRITVYNALEYLASGMSESEILADSLS